MIAQQVDEASVVECLCIHLPYERTRHRYRLKPVIKGVFSGRLWLCNHLSEQFHLEGAAKAQLGNPCEYQSTLALLSIGMGILWVCLQCLTTISRSEPSSEGSHIWHPIVN
jgi:hypothetical protein